MFLSSGQAVLAHLRAALRRGAPLDLAIAYWGAGAVKELDLTVAGEGTRVLLDALSGGTNPQALRELWACHPRVMVRHRSGLHAKVAITDTDLVVGSSNASAAGLGFNELSAETLIEAGALLSDARSRSDAASWFENEWERGTALDDKILATATAAWGRRSQARRLASRALDALPPNGAYVVVYGSYADPGVQDDGTQKLRARGEPHGAVFQGWPNMPRDALLIEYWVGKTKKVTATFQGVSRSLNDNVFDATRSDTKRRVKVYGVRVLPDPDEQLARLGFTERGLTQLIEQLIETFESRHPRGARAAFVAAGGEYVHVRDWCVPVDGFLALCKERELIAPQTDATP